MIWRVCDGLVPDLLHWQESESPPFREHTTEHRAMGNHHDQGSPADWQKSGQPAPAEPNPKADEHQAAGQPRGKNELGREMGPGDGDDPPPVTGNEPSPR